MEPSRTPLPALRHLSPLAPSPSALPGQDPRWAQDRPGRAPCGLSLCGLSPQAQFGLLGERMLFPPSRLRKALNAHPGFSSCALDKDLACPPHGGRNRGSGGEGTQLSQPDSLRQASDPSCPVWRPLALPGGSHPALQKVLKQYQGTGPPCPSAMRRPGPRRGLQTATLCSCSQGLGVASPTWGQGKGQGQPPGEEAGTGEGREAELRYFLPNN